MSHNVNPWDVEFGMPLKVVFKPKEERIGAITDFHFEPDDVGCPLVGTKKKNVFKSCLNRFMNGLKQIRTYNNTFYL